MGRTQVANGQLAPPSGVSKGCLPLFGNVNTGPQASAHSRFHNTQGSPNCVRVIFKFSKSVFPLQKAIQEDRWPIIRLGKRQEVITTLKQVHNPFHLRKRRGNDSNLIKPSSKNTSQRLRTNQWSTAKQVKNKMICQCSFFVEERISKLGKERWYGWMYR